MNFLKKEMVTCTLCGLVITVSLLPHNCAPTTFSERSYWTEEQAAYCESLNERHTHTPEESYPTQQMAIFSTSVGTAVGTVATSTTLEQPI